MRMASEGAFFLAIPRKSPKKPPSAPRSGLRASSLNRRADRSGEGAWKIPVKNADRGRLCSEQRKTRESLGFARFLQLLGSWEKNLAAAYFRTVEYCTIIGITVFHERVRNGNEWFYCLLPPEKL